VSPVTAAAHVSAPTLLIHGDRDVETPPSHSQRIFAALHDPKRLILVRNADHGHVVDARVWHEIDGWIDAALPPPGSKLP
jgi:dipeptidyl aminopeptidase/acylaminoacyl peptidase